MDYRQFGRSGLTVPVLSFGTGTFGGTNEFFQRWGQTDVSEATRMVDLCLDSGVSFFDTADICSAGASEEILGQALKGKRQRALISTKATFRFNDELNKVGSSRYHLIRACEASLKRLGTDHIDVYFMHGFDALTPVEETLRAPDDPCRLNQKTSSTPCREARRIVPDCSGWPVTTGRDREGGLGPSAGCILGLRGLRGLRGLCGLRGLRGRHPRTACDWQSATRRRDCAERLPERGGGRRRGGRPHAVGRLAPLHSQPCRAITDLAMPKIHDVKD
ncbi:aldo/keto reductase [Methylobacterium sp. GC_Met_2]|uniref:aldo/keto reductase n=1 Tax=Methylobacterium sp. GC_Met_2 TaxID=2937376 RepID=UPI00226B1A1E|nr:aldo/keto reductase [Methylobacterium sp. GC_Met_2]